MCECESNMNSKWFEWSARGGPSPNQKATTNRKSCKSENRPFCTFSRFDILPFRLNEQPPHVLAYTTNAILILLFIYFYFFALHWKRVQSNFSIRARSALFQFARSLYCCVDRQKQRRKKLVIFFSSAELRVVLVRLIDGPPMRHVCNCECLCATIAEVSKVTVYIAY